MLEPLISLISCPFSFNPFVITCKKSVQLFLHPLFDANAIGLACIQNRQSVGIDRPSQYASCLCNNNDRNSEPLNTVKLVVTSVS